MGMFDQRRNERADFTGCKIEYSFSPFFEGEVFEADVMNASEAGVCILSSNLLNVGQEITIRNFMTFSSRTAVVLWVEKCDEMFNLNESDEVLYRIGLQLE